jgi:N-methylhydantoinase B/oxoprolinase/acetone carboxylase alpha subunit
VPQVALQRASDRILLAVIENRMEGIFQHMMNTLLRPTRLAVIDQTRDLSRPIVIAENELLASAEAGLPSAHEMSVWSAFQMDVASVDARVQTLEMSDAKNCT